MKEVTFIKKSQFGNKGETRLVTDLAAGQFAKLGLLKAAEKELEPEAETKVLDPEVETKARVTTSPKEEEPKKAPKTTGKKGKK